MRRNRFVATGYASSEKHIKRVRRKRVKIWVDDIRTPPDDSWLWFKNSSESITALKISQYNGYQVNLISLDHDLGGDDTTRPIVIWMIENDFWPVEVKVHSANSVGIDWLEGMIERYKP